MSADDGPGCVIGSRVGIDAYELAEKYWDGSILSAPVEVEVGFDPAAGEVVIRWHRSIGLSYMVQSSPALAPAVWSDETARVRAEDFWGRFSVAAGGADQKYFRVLRSGGGA